MKEKMKKKKFDDCQFNNYNVTPFTQMYDPNYPNFVFGIKNINRNHQNEKLKIEQN